MRLLLLTICICFFSNTVFSSPAAYNIENFLDNYFLAHSNEDINGLKNMLLPDLPFSQAILNSWKTSWRVLKNNCHLMLKKNVVENDKRAVVSVESLWFGTNFQTGDILCKPVKNIFTLNKNPDGLKIYRIEKKHLPGSELLDKAMAGLLVRQKVTALKAIQKLLAKNSNDPHALYLFSYLMMLENKVSLAIKGFQKVLKIVPQHLAARSFLSSLSQKNLFNKTELETLAGAYFGLLTFNHLKMTERAVDASANILARFPDSSLIYGQLGRSYKARNIPEKAIFFFKKSLEKNPGSYESLFNISQLQIRENKLKMARVNLIKGLKLFPGHPGFLFLKTRFYLRKKKYKTARRILKPFLRKFPNYKPAIQLKSQLQALLHSKRKQQSSTELTGTTPEM
ncbi:tetratricopeptide repeat protein [Candidatus Riflebacteria bacterium]